MPLALLLGPIARPAPARATTETYLFRDTLAPIEGAGNVLPSGTCESIVCRLDALLARIQGESRLGSFQSGLAQEIQNAKARVLDVQAAATGKKRRNKLQQAAKLVSAYVHRLGSLTARKKLDATLRTDFMDDGVPILKDLKTRRAS